MISKFVEPGIRRQHMDTSGLGLDLRKNAIEIGEVRCIALKRCRIAADRGDGLIQLGRTAAGDKDARALHGETLCDAETDAGAAACHDGNLVGELAFHAPLPQLDLARRDIRQQRT
jgi:hypothetical protein